MSKYFIIFLSLTILYMSNAQSVEVSAEKKLILQDLMYEFIEDLSVDGKMIYIDTKSNKLNFSTFIN